jgi:hypothetical protein
MWWKNEDTAIQFFCDLMLILALIFFCILFSVVLANIFYAGSVPTHHVYRTSSCTHRLHRPQLLALPHHRPLLALHLRTRCPPSTHLCAWHLSPPHPHSHSCDHRRRPQVLQCPPDSLAILRFFCMAYAFSLIDRIRSERRVSDLYTIVGVPMRSRAFAQESQGRTMRGQRR